MKSKTRACSTPLGPNTRYKAKENIGAYITKGSIFELNDISPAMGIRPAHCTIHLLGSRYKLYITKPLFDAVKDKLERCDPPTKE